MKFDHDIDYSFLQVEGYKYVNFAVLHCKSMASFMDLCRYENAFLARESDFQRISAIRTAEDFYEPQHILLGKYSSRGITKPEWTFERMTSGQELELITSPLTLVDLGSDTTDWILKPVPKFKVQAKITGSLPWILKIMYWNRALPATENDANELESAIRGHREGHITVTLKNFVAKEVTFPWRIPEKN